MNNLLIYPIIIPLITGLALIFFRNYRLIQRWVSLICLLVTLALSVLMILQIDQHGVQTLHVGGWKAPFGITLVADMLAAILVCIALLVSLACLIYAFFSIGKERESFFVYPFFLFLICGVNGSFLTGDIFNLFVFFEVMLIASYVLLSIGGQKFQLRESLKYVLINMVSSTLFVVAIAYLYSVAGTLNMAHLSERIASIGQNGLLTTISIVFLIVFAIKSALFLYFWLPGSYSAPPMAIAAMFSALLTKVGIYAILRVFSLLFYHQPHITHTILIVLGALTMIFGAFGAVAHWRIRKILAYNVIISVGFIVFGIGVANTVSLSGTLFYLVHDMIAKALIFILGGAIISIAGTDRLKDIPGLILYRPLLGWLFFFSALALSGIPPLSGFVGKVMIIKGGLEADYYLISIIGLISSFFVLYSVMKVFIQSFWGETLLSEGEEHDTGKGALLPGAILTVFIIGLGLGAEWVLEYIDIAVETLQNPKIYIKAVLYME